MFTSRRKVNLISGNFARYLRIGKRILWQHSMKAEAFQNEKKSKDDEGDDADIIVLPSSVVLRKDLILLAEDKLEEALK